MKFWIRSSLLALIILLISPSMLFAQDDDEVDCWTDISRWCYNDAPPLDVLNDLVKNDSVIQTELDAVTTSEQRYWNPWLKVSETANSVRTNLSIYLQRIAFIGLTTAVMLIMYNWIRLMFTPLSPDQAAWVKTRLKYILFGVLLLTGFYFLLSIFLSIYLDIFVR